MTFTLTPKQIEATKLYEKYRHVMLYGGARSGKDFVCLYSIITKALETRSDHLVVGKNRNVNKSLTVDLLPIVLSLAFVDIEYKINKLDRTLEFQNGSKVWFKHLDSINSFDDLESFADNLHIQSFTTIMFHQCEEISLQEVNTILNSVTQGTNLPKVVMYTCSPTDIRRWTYSSFLSTGIVNMDDSLDAECLRLRCLHPFFNYDPALCTALQINPIDNLQNIPEGYIDMLSDLPPKERKRFLDGGFQDDSFKEVDGETKFLINGEDIKVVPGEGL